MKIAVLDDYQNVALEMADWTEVRKAAEVVVFNDTVQDPDSLIARLKPFDIVCAMRERSPMTAYVIKRLPSLKLIVSTGPRNASIDLEAASSSGVDILHTGYIGSPATELAWALILGAARNLTEEAASFRSGGWQVGVGSDLAGATLGVLGFGNLGSAVAKIGVAFGMRVIAWSPNLTKERAEGEGVVAVTKEELFRQSDFLTIHLVLAPSTVGLVGAEDLSLMKETAVLVNTSRGPIVDEEALVSALRSNLIGGAALDVFDTEPLPASHPYRSLPNVLGTPHVGHISRRQYRTFYGDTVRNILKWMQAHTA